MSEMLFQQVQYNLEALVNFIELGQIGLPDIQRPFVWKNTKVRDLFDSMYRGYPVGYLLLWQNGFRDDTRTIGTDHKQTTPRLLIVDGQQRLTSLYAVVKGIQVLRENYSTETIAIAFNPLLERFEVADAAIRRDKSYIPNISILWSKETDLFDLVDEYLENLASNREVNADERKHIRRAIQRLSNILTFPLTALELSPEIDEEQVAEVFVRINSKGTPLNQADFILTLMSVFWDVGRAELETFCRTARTPTVGEASPFNHFIHPDPDQLLRVNVGVGFKRARLKFVYSILRGKDLESEEFSAERRDAQFEVLKQAQARTLNLQYWHDFFKAIVQAGYKGGRLFTSDNNLLFTYVFYLIGRTEYGVDEHTLRQAIAKWFFMCSLTGRYTRSPESDFEFDLARLRGIKDGDAFITILRQICDTTLTGDFWKLTLPNELATSSPRSPSLFAYYASLILLDAKALFSSQRVADLMDPSVHAQRNPIERHHLFSPNYLKTLGITDIRETNQIANYAVTEWNDNVDISDQPPAEYLPRLLERVDAKELGRMMYWHALPDGWENMDYSDFLVQRRERMARVMADAYHRLSGPSEEARRQELSLADLLGDGETSQVEFKSTLRVNLHTGQKDPRMELAILKTVAGFLNTQGGTLLVGVADNGNPVGIEADGFPNEDKMNLHLIHLLRDRIGADKLMYVHPRFEDHEDERVLAVECWTSKSPVFVKDGNTEHFYIRTGTSTSELTSSQAHDFIKQRFES